MTKVETDLARDLFTVSAEKTRPTEAAMIAAVEGRGFKATVQTARQPPSSADKGVSPPAGALPALVQAALDQAKREKKLVLLDFYADWCGPCQRMLKETYPDPQVQAELQHFVFLKIDTDKHPAVARHFGVSGIPDTRILQPDGIETARFLGFKGASEVRTILQAARGGAR